MMKRWTAWQKEGRHDGLTFQFARNAANSPKTSEMARSTARIATENSSSGYAAQWAGQRA